MEVLKGGTYHREFVDDPERMEYFLPVRWIHTVPISVSRSHPSEALREYLV